MYFSLFPLLPNLSEVFNEALRDIRTCVNELLVNGALDDTE